MMSINTSLQGCVMVLATRRRVLSPCRVFIDWTCEICGGQIGTGTG